MILVVDSSPLIFLAKINQLSLISNLFNAKIIIPSQVKKEIIGPKVPPEEERLLTKFLSNRKIVNLRKPDIFARALSFADNCVLSLAHKEQSDIILSDDRLLRRVAVLEGFGVIGTLGILFHARKRSLLSRKKVLDLFGQLIEEHNFRISTSVYEAARKAIVAI